MKKLLVPEFDRKNCKNKELLELDLSSLRLNFLQKSLHSISGSNESGMLFITRNEGHSPAVNLQAFRYPSI